MFLIPLQISRIWCPSPPIVILGRARTPPACTLAAVGQSTHHCVICRLYLSDCFANSANSVGVLLLCDVSLGKQYERYAFRVCVRTSTPCYHRPATFMKLPHPLHPLHPPAYTASVTVTIPSRRSATISGPPPHHPAGLQPPV